MMADKSFRIRSAYPMLFLVTGASAILMIAAGASPFLAGGVGASALVPMFVWFRRRTSVDEGGLRLDGPVGLGSGYLPFSAMGRVLLVGGSRIAVDGADGERLISWSLDSDERDRFYHSLSERVRANESIDGSGFERGSRCLEAWVADLSQRLCDGQKLAPYRAVARDLSRFASWLRNAHLTNDLRAAAAFMLLGSGDPSAAEIVRTSIGPDAPPLVVVLAALAPHGDDFRPHADRVVRYLDRADRRSFASLLRAA